MSLLTIPDIRTPRDVPSPPTDHPGAAGTRPRFLAVVVDRGSAEEGLQAVLDAAREAAGEVHVAVLLPRPPLTLDAAVLTRTADLADGGAADLLDRVRRRRAAADVPTTTSLHLLGALHGGRRSRVIDRTARRIARRLDAIVLPGTPR